MVTFDKGAAPQALEIRGYLMTATLVASGPSPSLTVKRKVWNPTFGSTTHVPLADVVDVQWRRPTVLRGGWVRPVMRGHEAEEVSATVPAAHEHAVVFAQWQGRRARRLHEALQAAVGNLRR